MNISSTDAPLLEVAGTSDAELLYLEVPSASPGAGVSSAVDHPDQIEPEALDDANQPDCKVIVVQMPFDDVDKKEHFICEVCMKKFTRRVLLKCHMMKHSRSFSCDKCEEKFWSQTGLNKHYRLHRGMGPAKPVVKEENVPGTPHTGQSVPPKPFLCNVCNKIFASKQNLMSHQKIHINLKAIVIDGTSWYVCKICNDTFKTKDLLIEHMPLHTGEKPYVCDICDERFWSRGHLKDHVQIHVDPDNFTPEEKSKDGLHIGGMSVCVICYAKFPNTAELLQHKQHHEASVPYCCSNCNEAFTTLPFLTEHKRIHSGEKPLDCQWCDRSFTTTRLLQEHRQTHFMAVYKCNDCANVFKSKRQLQIHHDKFHMSKPCFICEFCGKKFAYENKMKSHLDLHKQEDIFSHVTIEIDDQTGL